MHTSKIRFSRLAVLIAALTLLGPAALSAAQPSVGPAPEMIGTIPGTGMLRDEFRARALVQLSAAALNAIEFKLVKGDYPTNFGQLRGSNCWNLELTNIFDDQPVRGIYFEATPDQMTDDPVVDMSFDFELPKTPATVAGLPGSGAPGSGGTGGGAGGEGAGDNSGGGTGGGNGGGGTGFDPSVLQEAFQTAGPPAPKRVNPKAITGYTPGDIFYYTDGKLLQLVMFAPDGTYLEYVDEAPNASKINRLTVRIEGAKFPDDWLAAQVLYFTETLLPQYYNLVQFMGSRETIPNPEFATMGVGQRLGLAIELGITVENPYKREPAKLSETFSEGDFIDPDPALGMPLHLCLRGGRIMTHAELIKGSGSGQPPQQPAQQKEQPKKRRGAPPMGGRH